MWFVSIGVVLILLKFFEIALVDTSWLWVLSPFAAAVVWWWWADTTGYTKRRAMDKMDKRKEERRRKHIVDLGMEERGRRAK